MSNHFTGLSLGPPLGDQRLDLYAFQAPAGLAVEKSNHRHCRLLRACHQRPRRRPAKPCDKRASSHSMTSSARASRFGGISRPSG